MNGTRRLKAIYIYNVKRQHQSFHVCIDQCLSAALACELVLQVGLIKIVLGQLYMYYNIMCELFKVFLAAVH